MGNRRFNFKFEFKEFRARKTFGALFRCVSHTYAPLVVSRGIAL